MSAKLLWQFFFLYCGVMIFGMITITADNLFINGVSLKRLSQFNFKAISLQAFCAVTIFQIYTMIRLRPPLTWKKLTRFPMDIFWAMMIFAMITSPLYHIADTFFTEPAKRDQPWAIALSITFELSLCLGLAILLFTLIRRLLRPYILKLSQEEIPNFIPSSFIKPLILSFTSLLIICVLRPIKYVIYRVITDKPIEPSGLLLVAFTTVLYALILYFLLIWQYRKELRSLIQGILSLLEGNRSWLKRRIPIMSTDEMGELGTAFNTLQEKISQNYEEVEQEIQLAYQVQQKLLPPSLHNLGHYEIAATCQPAKEVGGDLYDILPLDSHRFALITGDVSGKGMPAALMMSAVLALFRAEVRRGGSAGEVLTRLNRSVVETLQQGNMFITLGVGIIDRDTNTLEYASAGHMSPYILRRQNPITIPCSSLPLGIKGTEIYSEVSVTLQSEDRVVFYTDGVVEAMDKDGVLYGFQKFEDSLTRLDPQLPLQDQIQVLLNQLPKASNSYNDDRTILLLKCNDIGIGRK